MPPINHAVLSASSSHRWLACPPSARACESESDRASPYAQEGTAAHAMCEYKLQEALGMDPKNPAEDLDYFDSEMDECSDDYCSFVIEQLASAKEFCSDPKLMIEEHLDFSRWVPDGFGTGDALIVADKVLHIIDYKYGLGVLVEAEGNPQMRCYALGAIDAYDGIYDIEAVKMTIFQPRRGNVSTAVMSKAKLLEWADSYLAPRAKLAYEGKGEYQAGDHCRFCKIRATCRERAAYNMELAKYDFELPAKLDPREIALILPKIDELVTWANDVKEHALTQALLGVQYDGFKVVEGRSVRKYTDETAVAATVENAGYDPYEKKVLGITAMTRLLGKSTFNELLEGYIIKPPGKPTLVPDTDNRPAINTAIEDFKDN